MPVRVRPSSVRLPATSTPDCSIRAIAGAVPITMSAVSPFASRFRTAPIVPNVNSTWSPASRASLAAKSVRTYFSAPADNTFRRAGDIVPSSLVAPRLADVILNETANLLMAS